MCACPLRTTRVRVAQAIIALGVGLMGVFTLRANFKPIDAVANLNKKCVPPAWRVAVLPGYEYLLATFADATAPAPNV